jgi:hypothetical protein
MQKNIVIVGYPKSGTTWLSRLVAELVQCNFIGDWGFDTENPSRIILEDDSSEFVVYKSHHSANEIEKASKKMIHKIIYIIRDPRDVVISGVHFFDFTKLKNSFFNKILRNLFSKRWLISSYKMKKKKMIQAVLFGNKSITPWLKVSWKNHYRGYLNKNVLFIKYEDLSQNAEIECNKIASFLDFNVSPSHIEESINNQSIEVRKKEVFDLGNKNLIKLVRKGSSGYWKDEFSNNEILLFKNNLKDANDHYEF